MLSNAVIVVVKVFSFYFSIVVEISEQEEEEEKKEQQCVCRYEPVIKRQSAELREFQKDSADRRGV